MKKLIFVLSFVPLLVTSQNKNFQDMLSGAAHTMKEALEVYPKSVIEVGNRSNGTKTKTSAVIISATKDCYCTIVIVELDKNTALIFGYAPGVTNGNFNGYGEFLLYSSKNGKVAKKMHLYEPLKSFSADNVKKEYLKKENIEVVISEKFDVEYFNFEAVPAIYFLPKDYFDYK